MSDQEVVDDIMDNVKEDCSDIDVDVDDNQEKPLLPANISLLISKYCAYEDGDKSWEIKADGSSSDECDADLPTCSKLLQADNPNTQGTEKKILVPIKKLKNSNCKTSNDKELKKSKLKKQSGLNATKRKHSLDDKASGMNINSKFSQINVEENCEMDRIIASKKRLEVNVKSGEFSEKSRLNTNVDNGQDFSETNNTSSDLPDSTNIFGPSCSTDLAGASNSTGKLHLVSDLPESNVDKKLVTNVLLDICNKLYLTDCREPTTTPIENDEQNQDVSVVPIEQCPYLKGVPANLKYSGRDGSDSQTKNAQCFVEDDDVVNPDIMHNIELNEHRQQMEILIQKIITTTDDDQKRSILDECTRLTPIPRIEHERETFTAQQRSNFLHGVCEQEYEIDRDDWNKIMVKRAVVFTAHAGFSIANEESLYVLADVTVDYIKKLAIIFKRNFDIQSDSTYPDIVDPITNSLREIDVNGGVEELIKHYENDVYGRRDKLIEKCEHLHGIIDRFVERSTDPDNLYTVVEQEPWDESAARDIRTEADDEATTMADANTVVGYAGRVPVGGDDGRTSDFDLLKPFTGYVFHGPETWTADAGKIVGRVRPNASGSRNKHVFDLRDYELPYNVQVLDRSRSFVGPCGSRSAANDEGTSCATTVVRSSSSATANARGDRRRPAVAFRQTLMSDLEDRFRRFTSSREHDDDATSAGHDEETAAETVRDGGDAVPNAVTADGEPGVSTKFHVPEEETRE